MEKGGQIRSLKIKKAHAQHHLMSAYHKIMIICGQVAKRQAVTNPDNFSCTTKRYMGHKEKDKVVQDAKVSYRIKPAKNGDVRFVVDYQGKEELWSPEKVGSIILQR